MILIRNISRISKCPDVLVLHCKFLVGGSAWERQEESKNDSESESESEQGTAYARVITAVGKLVKREEKTKTERERYNVSFSQSLWDS